MFENNQDTTIFLHALSSVTKNISFLQDKESDKIGDAVQNAVNVVFTCVNNILVHNLMSIKDEIEFSKKHVHISRRIHAVMFFAALKSHGIVSSEANIHYQSIMHCLPKVNWQFYTLLNSKCHWSKYFVECAEQLPTAVLTKVSNEIFEASSEKHLKYYSSHLILEAVINSTSQKNVYEELLFSFSFTFESKPDLNCEPKLVDTLEKNDNCKLEPVEILESSNNFNSYEKILELLKCEEQEDLDCLKVILHALKCVFTVLNRTEHCNAAGILQRFADIFKLANQKLSLSSYQKILELSIHSSVYSLQHYDYSIASWDISGIYLSFLVYYYWTDFQQKVISTKFSEILQSTNLTDCVTEIKDGCTTTILKCFNPLLKEETLSDNHVKLLKKVFEKNLPCAERAGEILLSHLYLLKNKDILAALTENFQNLNPGSSYPFLTNAIMNSKSSEVKNTLLKLFYQVLSQAPLTVYDEVLKYISSNYGFSKNFKLPDFHADVLKFQCSSNLSFEEVQKILPPLFIQSPEEVLNYVIEEVLLEGCNGASMIKALKYVPTVCSYKSSDEDLPLLVKTVKCIFDKDELKPSQLKNMTVLFKFLTELHLECRCIPPYALFNSCIIPNLDITVNWKMGLSLECLNATLEVLVSADKPYIDKDCLIMLVTNLGSLINSCIEFKNGNLKDLATTALSMLGKIELKHQILDDESKISMKDTFSSYDPAVILYAHEILPVEIEASKLPIDLLWTWCCIIKNTSPLESEFIKNCVSYTDVLNILVQLLPHFSNTEWLYSVEIIKLFLKYSSPEDKMIAHSPFNISDEFSHLYSVLRYFLESFPFIFQNFQGNNQHLCTCFTNTIMSIVKEKEGLDPLFSLSLFLDMCYLTSRISEEKFPLFSSVLYNLQKNVFVSCNDEKSKLFVENVVKNALKCLPGTLAESS